MTIKRCKTWADQGASKCLQWADHGTNACKEWADQGSKHCCDWFPCNVLCKVWYWVANWVCVAWYWVAKWVCVAWYWVAKWVCVAWVTISIVFGKAARWLRDLFKPGCITPFFDPLAWNDANGIQYNNNCYNYACDKATGTYAQPGRASGAQWTTIDCADVTAGATADGLKQVDCSADCPTTANECCHKVALVVKPSYPQDYHWYRQDSDFSWSHKLGGTEATNLDSSGALITDPRTADRGAYTVFCGCFCVCKGKVTIG